MNFFKNKLLVPYTIVIVLVTALVSGYVVENNYFVNEELSAEKQYELAVEDSMIAEKSEIEPLVVINPERDMVTYNDTKDKVLLLSWNKYPESYKEGSEVTMKYGEVWTFTDKEMKAWYKENGKDVEDWDMRLRQLLGLPPTSEYTHVSAFWVNPADVYRPAYNSDITTDKMKTTLDKNVDENFKSWFDGNIVWSYFEGDYPWTRLGYTYDWGNEDSEYGLSEFLIAKDAVVEVEFTKTTKEFIQYLQDK